MKTLSGSRDSAVPRHILLVDDNDMGLAARQAILREQGYRITTANDGIEALAAFKNGLFDLVITDFKMPGMDGVELIENIRRLNPAVPIVLISGYADGLGLNENSTGADSVVAKNAHEIQHLLRAVNRMLNPAPKKPVQSQRARTRVRHQIV